MGYMRLPEAGSVLGVDVGCSEARRSSAACRLDWDLTTIAFSAAQRFRALEPERSNTLRAVADRHLLVAAFDGPLRPGLDLIDRYRLAEQLLTRQFQALIGKPGQSSSPVGRRLNCNANACARIALDTGMIASAAHDHAIHMSAIVEAFPTAFLGLLIKDPVSLSVHRGNRSDSFYVFLTGAGGLMDLLQRVLPGRRLTTPFQAITNHDDRAAAVCALTALCVAAGEYTAVGDGDGWIVLPPQSLIQPWAWTLLLKNAHHGGLESRTARSLEGNYRG